MTGSIVQSVMVALQSIGDVGRKVEDFRSFQKALGKGYGKLTDIRLILGVEGNFGST
jgi:hypothetical protein